MACDLSLGRLEPCKEFVGGLKAIYFANFDGDIYTGASLDADDQITGFATPVTLYKYELKATTNTFEETNENSRDAGSSFWTQTGTFVLKGQDLQTQKELKLLAAGRPHIVIEDYNGNFRLAGFENGCECAVNTTSGGAMGDLNGYNVTATGTEKAPANFIDPAIIDDTTNTTVVVGV